MKKVIFYHTDCAGFNAVIPPGEKGMRQFPWSGKLTPRAHFASDPALQSESRRTGQPISPLVGEMSGRTEGGKVEQPLETIAPPPSPAPQSTWTNHYFVHALQTPAILLPLSQEDAMNCNAATDRHRNGKRRGQFTCFRPESAAEPERTRAETSKLSPEPDLRWRRGAMDCDRATDRRRTGKRRD